MRITHSFLFRRFAHAINEPCKLKIEIVGTPEELEDLTKTIESLCSEKDK
jgi:hypothetical protein